MKIKMGTKVFLPPGRIIKVLAIIFYVIMV